jgi:CRP/FNR family cyclic AMP-dependent transcriptional regulator
MSAQKEPRNPPKPQSFDAEAFLASSGVAGKVVLLRRGEVIFSQGDPCESVLYIQRGRVTLRVLSDEGKEAIVARLGAGDFFGEGALSEQPVRLATAVAASASALLVIEKQQMIRLLHENYALSDRFLAYVLARNIRIEADLVDQVFNFSERRLARTLLLLAQYGKREIPFRVLPMISPEMLAEMIGTTRSRMKFFMKKFEKLGYIQYNGSLKINEALMSVALLPD